MRKSIVGLASLGIVVLALSGCAPAAQTAGGSLSGSSPAASAPAAAASGPTGKINMCSAFTAAALSAASGKSFTDTIETDSGDGVYGCAYDSSDESFDWIVDVQESTDGTVSDEPIDLGGKSAVHNVSGTGYPTVASSAGVDMTVGTTIVEVYTASKSAAAKATTDQFVKVAKAALAAVSK